MPLLRRSQSAVPCAPRAGLQPGTATPRRFFALVRARQPGEFFPEQHQCFDATMSALKNHRYGRFQHKMLVFLLIKQYKSVSRNASKIQLRTHRYKMPSATGFAFQRQEMKAMTGQATELCIYEAEAYDFYERPLEPLMEEKGWTDQTFSNGFSTACWRGYMGKWHVSDGKLFLISLADCFGEEIDLATIFPDRNIPVLAEWFTGIIRLPYGNPIASGPWGPFAATHFAHHHKLSFRRGVLFRTQKHVASRILDKVGTPAARHWRPVTDVVD